jgi:hypothetical protein
MMTISVLIIQDLFAYSKKIGDGFKKIFGEDRS